MSENTSGPTAKEIATTESSSTLNPRDFIFRYLKYFPWVIAGGIVGLTLAYLKLRYIVPIYKSQSSLLIKNDQDKGMGKDARFEELLMNQQNANLSNETAILRSRPLLKRVVRNLNLQTSYYNQGNLRSSILYPFSPIQLEIVSLVDSSKPFGFTITLIDNDDFTINEDKVKHSFGEVCTLGSSIFRLKKDKNLDLRSYGSPKFSISWQPLAAAAEILLTGLKVAQLDDQATILTLSMDNESVAMSMNILNDLMAVYDSSVIEDKNRIILNTERFIDERLKSLKSDLIDIEGNMKSNMEQNGTFDVQDQSKKYFDNISENEKQLIELEVKTKVADFLSEYIKNRDNDFKLVPTNLGIEEPVLIQLVTEYNRLQLDREANLRTTSAKNAMIIGMEGTLEKMRVNIKEALQSVKNAYQIGYARLKKEQEGIKGEMRTLPGKSIKFLNVQRQQKILEDLYSFLLQKKLESSISSASTISNSKVLEPALGGSVPISPDRKKLYTFYLLMGLVLPLGFVAVLEVLKDKVSSRTEVERRTSAPILGEIGHSEDTKTSLVVRQNSRSIVAEQFRIVRANLRYVSSVRENMTILVTSSFSGEGKSFISTNMGAVMALSGKKTVIMEFDIRKPKIISGLDLKRKMGISNYIIGKASFNDLLVKVEGVDNLYVIPCGPIPPNPAEILLDSRLDDLMKEVMENFEIVIMDTAPIGLVSDAVSLSRFANATLYVIRQGYTFRKQIKMIDDLYVSKKLPSLTLLLNDVKSGAGYYGGYGYYGGNYGYGVKSGYFDDDKKQSERGLLGGIRRWWNKMFK
jgi:capsular exopolysaccharide synthesis family protein